MKGKGRRDRQPYCRACGRFIKYGTGKSYFTPDSEYSTETMEWECADHADPEGIPHAEVY